MLNAGSKDPAYTVRAALLIPIAWISLAGGASAQSADKIVERHVKAIGGKDALERILSATITGTVTLADGQTGTFIEETKRPNSLHISLAWKDGHWSTGFNGRSAWQDDRRDGLRTLMGRPAASVRADAAYANRDVFTEDGRRQLILVGKDQVRGRPVFVVDAMTHDLLKRTLFFDANTYLLLKEQYETDAGMEIRFFDDYRRVGAVMEPHRIRVAEERRQHSHHRYASHSQCPLSTSRCSTSPALPLPRQSTPCRFCRPRCGINRRSTSCSRRTRIPRRSPTESWTRLAASPART
jgi:hypothetical protein